MNSVQIDSGNANIVHHGGLSALGIVTVDDSVPVDTASVSRRLCVCAVSPVRRDGGHASAASEAAAHGNFAAADRESAAGNADSAAAAVGISGRAGTAAPVAAGNRDITVSDRERSRNGRLTASSRGRRACAAAAAARNAYCSSFYGEVSGYRACSGARYSVCSAADGVSAAAAGDFNHAVFDNETALYGRKTV